MTQFDLEFTISLAKEAGSLLQGFFQSISLATRRKADRSLVTQADLDADELIAGALHDRFPEDVLISEELAPTVPPGIDPKSSAIWVIDPLDGTTNFSMGLLHWGVSLARLEMGIPKLAVVYFPMLNQLYTAEHGTGAKLNHQPINIDPEAHRNMSFFSCCSRTYHRYEVDIPYKTRIFGCASYTYCAVASSVAVLGFEATPKIWDIAAAWLVVEEAGGAIGVLEGPPPFPIKGERDYTAQVYPTIAAATMEQMDWGKARIKRKVGRDHNKDGNSPVL